MLDFLMSVLFFIVGIVLGFYLMLLGRRRMMVTTAIVCIAATAGLLSLIFHNDSNGWVLVDIRDWLLLGITVAAGVIGGILGTRAQPLAVGVIGFFAGGYIGLWLYEIAHFIVVDVVHWPERTAFWVGVAILIVGGLLGIFFTRRSEAIAIIIISVFIGVDLIGMVLNLNPSKSYTAVIMLSLALVGLVVQYAQYLRDIRVEQTIPFSQTVVSAPAPEYFDLSDDH